MVRKEKTREPSNGVLPKLKAVYDFMTQNNLDSLEISESGLHMRMVRRKSPAPTAIPVPVLVGASLPVPAQTTSVQAPQAQGAVAPPVPGGITVKSSMMGIFYRAPSPSSPPFVKEGDAVKAGQVLCMIEAMKVFNEIKAEFPCTILKVLLENGKPVKSGQDLFVAQRA